MAKIQTPTIGRPTRSPSPFQVLNEASGSAGCTAADGDFEEETCSRGLHSAPAPRFQGGPQEGFPSA